jgi:hypothetical protein
VFLPRSSWDKKKQKKYFLMQQWAGWVITANIVRVYLQELGNMPNLLTQHHLAVQNGHQGTFARTVYIVNQANQKIAMVVLASNSGLHIVMQPTVVFSRRALANLAFLHSVRTSFNLPSL